MPSAPVSAAVGMFGRMISAVHTLVYTDEPEAARAFFKDVLRWPHVDTGGGWLIFKTGPSEMGVHPTSWETDGEEGSVPPHHEISLVCDDLEATMSELRARGATFTREIRDDGFGLTTELAIPGGPSIMIYQPRYDPPALSL
jgi:predicted enzyme related to lactoylglutathione lyase